VDSNNRAAVRLCSDGPPTIFIPFYFGSRLQFVSGRKGDCFNGPVFSPCSQSALYTLTGLPGQYQIHVAGQTYCVDREHCHFATSNIRFYDCEHCGAIHWNFQGTKLGEDGMANCLVRLIADQTGMVHCSDFHEDMAIFAIPDLSAHKEISEALVNYDNAPQVGDFPTPNALDFDNELHLLNINGFRVFQYNDGTVKLEVVLNVQVPFSTSMSGSLYQVDFYVLHIHTNIYEAMYTPRFLINYLTTNPARIVAMNIRYGAQPLTSATFRIFCNLAFSFYTNSYGTSIPQDMFANIIYLMSVLAPQTAQWVDNDNMVENGSTIQVYVVAPYPNQSGYPVPLYWQPTPAPLPPPSEVLKKL